jgi:hypothetical protein
MFRLSPQLLIATSRALAGLRVTEWDFGDTIEAEPRADPLGDSSRRDEAPRSWAVRFVLECGYWSHYEQRSRSSSWPIPRGLTTPDLALFGLAHNVLYDLPEPGDIFLMWGRRQKMFIHAGVVVDVLAIHRVVGMKPFFDVYSAEGDTDEMGRLARGKAMRVRRRLSAELGDQFLRWTEIQRRDTGRTLSGLQGAMTPGRRAS